MSQSKPTLYVRQYKTVQSKYSIQMDETIPWLSRGFELPQTTETQAGGPLIKPIWTFPAYQALLDIPNDCQKSELTYLSHLLYV